MDTDTINMVSDSKEVASSIFNNYLISYYLDMMLCTCVVKLLESIMIFKHN